MQDHAWCCERSRRGRCFPPGDDTASATVDEIIDGTRSRLRNDDRPHEQRNDPERVALARYAQGIECHFPAGVECDVDPATDKAEVVAVGPIGEQAAPGNVPYTQCYLQISYKVVGQRWDPSYHGDHYPCTVYGADIHRFEVHTYPKECSSEVTVSKGAHAWGSPDQRATRSRP